MKDFLQKNIKRLEGERKEVLQLEEENYREEYFGWNSLLDQEIEYYKEMLKFINGADRQNHTK